MDLLDSLNDKQREAVQSLDGFYRVIAGAGSGKTKTLTHRFAWLVHEHGVPSERILCVTFTNKAADEMKERIKILLDNNVDLHLNFVCTFHSFCVKVLRQEIGILGLDPKFKILDVDDQKLMMKEMYKRYGISARDYSIDDALQRVNRLKTGGEWINPVMVLLGRGSIPVTYDMDQLTKIAIRFLSFQREIGGLDFNDLITFTTFLFKLYPEVRTRWSARFDYIMVDETQDNSILQWMLLDFLSEVNHNLYVVGDPDQAIYSFRGAKPDFLVSLDQKYNCKTIILDRNYRSTPVILNAANNVISHNRNRVKKDLYTNQGIQGDLIKRYHADDVDDEGTYVAKQVKAMLSQGVDPNQIAVLFRISALSRAIEQSFIKAGIPYVVYGGTRFFERQEIKDSLAFLSLLVNDDDDIAFLRVINKPARKLGDSFIAELSEIGSRDGSHLYPTLRANIGASNRLSRPSAAGFVSLIERFRKQVPVKPISALLTELLEESGYMNILRKKDETDRMDNISELIGSIQTYEQGYADGSIVSINQYLQDISLFTNMDTSVKTDAVKLMTIHQSKGLEFDNVFLIGFNEDVLPSFRALMDKDPNAAIEEERRFAYVAITRAKSNLFVSEIERGYRGNMEPSRFLKEIDGKYLELVVRESDSEKLDRFFTQSHATYPQRRHRIFVLGSKVRHADYGIGEVTRLDEDKRLIYIQFRRFKEPIGIDFEDVKLNLLRFDQHLVTPEAGKYFHVLNVGLCKVISVDEIDETFSGIDPDGNVIQSTWE